MMFACIAMVERLDNGLVVRFREPVKTRRKLSSLLPPAYPQPGGPPERSSEGWKDSGKEDEDVEVHLLELKAIFCPDDDAVLKAIKRARAGNEAISTLRREDALVLEANDGEGSGPFYAACS
jgi:hypothetical protein